MEKEFTYNKSKWRVKLVDKDHESLTSNFGLVDVFNQVIYMQDNLTPKVFRRILTHELVHMVLWEHGMEQVEISDEIMADFISVHGEDIITLSKRLTDGVYFSLA